jgi:hypothetical protein
MSFSVLATKQTWARQAREKECAHFEYRRVAPPDPRQVNTEQSRFSEQTHREIVAKAGEEWARVRLARGRWLLLGSW